MKHLFLKFSGILISLALIVILLVPFVPASHAREVTDDNSNVSALNCYDSNYSKFDTKECIEIRLGIDEVDFSNFIFERSPYDFLVLFFQFVLAIIFGVTVYRAGRLSFDIGNSKEDSPKLAEALKKLGRPLIAFALALSALGITNYMQTALAPGSNPALIDCETLARQFGSNPTDDQIETLDRCRRIEATKRT